VPSGPLTLTHKPVPTIRKDLLELFDRSELAKYLTEEELSVLDEGGSE
jgi:succinate dehydrogenase / fumarate reductase flavoprotein subunit